MTEHGVDTSSGFFPPRTVSFACALCDAGAGTTTLSWDAGRLKIVAGGNSFWLDASRRAAVEAAFADGRAPAIHRLDHEYVPSYCPVCDACFCAAHWHTWLVFDDDEPGWLDCVRGRCPNGHERMISD